MNTHTNWEQLGRIAVVTLSVLAFVVGAVNQRATAAVQEPTIVHGGVVNGKAISLPKPAYPEYAKAAQASGPVRVEVTIDEEGNVIEAEAVSGHELLRDASVAAAREAKFSPTRLNGVPVKVTGTIIYNFVADGDPNGDAPPTGPVGPADPDGRAQQNIISSATPDDPGERGPVGPAEGGVSGGVLNGKALALPKPRYPAPARAAHSSGVVQVRVTIDEEGKVIEADAVKGPVLLRAAAVEAARGARFYPTKLEGKPVKVTGIIIYNFAMADGPPGSSSSGNEPTGPANTNSDSTASHAEAAAEPDSKSAPKSTHPVIVSGGLLNGRAIVFPQPDYPAVARSAGASGAVNVQVTVDEAGNVISATAVSGPVLLLAAAVAAARGAKFSPVILSGTAVKVTGTLVYDFPAETGSQKKVISGGILNGKALSLPKPVYPDSAIAARASGIVEVKITIDEEGNVAEAEAVTGHELLRQAAVDAARGAKFAPTKLEGVPVRVTGRLIYNFTAPDDSGDIDSPVASLHSTKPTKTIVAVGAVDDRASSLAVPVNSTPAKVAPASGSVEVKPIYVDVGILNDKAISLPVPIYPAPAKAAHASGLVEVKVTIDGFTGEVIAAEAIRGPVLLKAAAAQAARGARFYPTMVTTGPLRVTGTLLYEFIPE